MGGRAQREPAAQRLAGAAAAGAARPRRRAARSASRPWPPPRPPRPSRPPPPRPRCPRRSRSRRPRPSPAAADRSEALTESAEEGSGPLDLSANLDPRLVVEASPSLAEGQEIPLGGGLTIGRSEAADITISDQFVSHMHARVTRRGAYHFVVDLGSTNGTFLNDRRIDSDAQLKVRDTLRIGQSILRYEE